MIFQDFQWVVADCECAGFSFRTGKDGTIWFLQVVANGPCAVSGKPIIWTGRKWRISRHAVRSEIVQTALMAILAAVEHEARESFRYKGQPIFGPHFNVDRLVELCAAGNATEERPTT